VVPVVDQHSVNEARGGGIEAEVVHEMVRERCWIPFEVLDHHKQRREDRDHEVEGEERGLQRPVDRLIETPRVDRDAPAGGRMLTVDPLVAATGHRLDARLRSTVRPLSRHVLHRAHDTRVSPARWTRSDAIGGISIIVDRRLAVGDFVDLADSAGRVGTSGVVEAVGLSSTTLRNSDGEIWHVPNGDIRWIGNLSERWARIVIDVRIGYDADLRAAKNELAAAIAQVVDDGRYRDAVLERPEEPFVRELGDDAAVLRATLRVDRGRLDSIKAAALERIAEALPEAGLGPALPGQMVRVSS
jgi:hypothetical protein